MLDQRFCQPTKDWGWDKKTKIMANIPLTTMKNFWHIVNFVCVRYAGAILTISHFPEKESG